MFPKILWNRPLSRGTAGRLLLVGGHREEFSQIQAVYQMALAAGAGECRVVLPDILQKLLADTPGTNFVPSSPSGSLGKGALAQILHLASECDAIAIGASLSNNSETVMLVESLLGKYDEPVIAFDQAPTLVKHRYRLIADRPNCLIVATMQQVFKLAGGLDIGLKIEPNPGVINKIEVMAQVAAHSQAGYLLTGRDMVAVADGQLSLTSADGPMDSLAAATAAVAAVFWLQNPASRFAGLTTAAYVLRETQRGLADRREVITTAEMTKAISRAVDRY